MPNSVLTRQRSWVARIAVLALFASLLVMGAVPAGAAGHINDTSASCPSSIPSAGFTDIATYDATTQAAINCIAEYGITKGTSATTYGPAVAVARWQMALFLTRQAAVHGVTLPSGADQGFTDISGLDAATQTAINQLAQLGISKGTSTTTFSPNDDVTREQMALFLARLLGAVTTLPASPAAAGFTDITGLSAESQLAINQLAAVGVAAGTSATTYAPAADVLRWQMALFLTRVLAEDGITPPVKGSIAISPTDDAMVVAKGGTDDTSDDRVYTATGLDDTKTYKLNLFDAAGIDTSGASVVVNSLTAAAGAQITVVNGAAVTAGPSASTKPVNGLITFTVDAVAGEFEDVAPVIWLDSDNDGSLDLNSSKNPTEPFGIGGIAMVFPEEADNGASVALADDALIDGAVKASGIIVAGGKHWVYDANDKFYIDANDDDAAAASEQVSKTAFEAKLTEGGGDEIGVLIYFQDDTLVSEWVLTNKAPAAPTIALAANGETQLTVTVTGLSSGATANVRVLADGAASTATPVKSHSSATDMDSTTAGFQVTVTGLTENTAYDVYATQTVAGETSADSNKLDVTTLADVAPTVAAVIANEFNDGIGSTNQIKVTFSENVTLLDAAKFTVTAGGFTFTGTAATVSGKVVTVTLDGTMNDVVNSGDIEYTLDLKADAVADLGGKKNVADATKKFDY